jgi:hypothetical protein
LLGCAATEPRIGPDPTQDQATATAGVGGAATGVGGGPATTGAGGDGTGGDGTGGDASRAPGWVSGSRLRARLRVGADGSKSLAGWRDTKLGVDCFFLLAGDGKLRCLPEQAGTASHFSDAGCTQPAMIVTKGCAAPAYAWKWTTMTDSCGTQTTYAVHPVGPAVATIFSGSPPSCVNQSTLLMTTLDAYAVGAEVPASEFVEATEVVE